MSPILFSMFIFAITGAITPGPVNIIAASAGANFGVKRTIPYILGATIAYTLVVLLMGIGLNQTLKLYPQISQNAKYIGGAFLLYMAFKIGTSPPADLSDTSHQQLSPVFLDGFLVQALNPKAWLVAMSGISLFVLPNSPPKIYLSFFCSISFIACFVGVGAWGTMGQLISRFLSTRKRQFAFNITMGLLLSGTVVYIFLS